MPTSTPSHVDRDADAIEHVLDADLVRSLEEVLGATAGAVPPSPHALDGGVVAHDLAVLRHLGGHHRRIVCDGLPLPGAAWCCVAEA